MSSPPPRSAPLMSSVGDRLGSMLFLAALAHGIVILGVTFTANPLAESESLPSLRVTLLNDSGAIEREPDDAEFLADRAQRGGGPAEAGQRATTTLAADDPAIRFGEPLASYARAATPGEPDERAELLVSPSPNDAAQRVPTEPSGEAVSAPTEAAALILQSERATAAAEIDVEARAPRSVAEEGIASPDTRESALAAYLVDWRRRVERVGTGNFPRRLLEQGSELDNPTLEVTLAADGQLERVVVRRSSGNPELDLAAVAILRRAAPFDPFPAPIRAEYDVLRFAYDWEFSPGAQAAPDSPVPE